MVSITSILLFAAHVNGDAQFLEGTAMLQSMSRASVHREDMQPIPRILHRVMLPREDGGVDCEGSARTMMESTRNHFHSMNPGWKEYIWGQDAIDKLVNNSKKIFASYPGIEDFAETYRNMDEWIYQQDTIRHVILFHFGGLYMDLDMDCTENVSPFLEGAELVLRAGGKTNFMGTRPHHPFSVAMMKRIGDTFKAGLDIVIENRPTAIWLTGEKQISATLLAEGIDSDIEDYPNGRDFTAENFGHVRLMGSNQVENTPKEASCIHGMQNSWHNKEGIVPAVAQSPKNETELAASCPVLYDNRTLWGEDLIEWIISR